ncbi:hypothetical protein DFR37_11934 [Eoetvoesiella caeni]|uniref:Uncharacterized protein n=1 Tax=Eoetvoesiella caeni TaxID=645616 RepID=A0A366H1R8_9BURK|nr:hypothetical protein DFR37_11934 [Eoetvoesiella caeni]
MVIPTRATSKMRQPEPLSWEAVVLGAMIQIGDVRVVNKTYIALTREAKMKTLTVPRTMSQEYTHAIR